MKIYSLLLLSLFFIYTINCKLSVQSRKLINDKGNIFFMQGVCYYPIPVGFDPAVKYEQYRDTAQDRSVWERDLNLIASMGGNTIRMYGFENNADHTAFFDMAYSKGIQVLVQYWWDTGKALNDPTILSGFINMITKQQHPAVGMWILNNELNYKYTGVDLVALFTLFNTMVDEVVKLEGANHRPVTTTLANVNNMIGTIRQFDAITKLDVWSVQIYNGFSFGNTFNDYAAASTKPLVVTEFGVDAFNFKTKLINEDDQRTAAESLFKELYDNDNITSGGTIYSYVDEWWKCGTNDVHDATCGGNNNNFPDDHMDEEYFGIYSVTKNPTGPDTLIPRSAAVALTTLWKAHIPSTTSTTTTNGASTTTSSEASTTTSSGASTTTSSGASTTSSGATKTTTSGASTTTRSASTATSSGTKKTTTSGASTTSSGVLTTTSSGASNTTSTLTDTTLNNSVRDLGGFLYLIFFLFNIL
jgi:hypothetical protein